MAHYKDINESRWLDASWYFEWRTFLKCLLMLINGTRIEIYEKTQCFRQFDNCETQMMKRIQQKNIKHWYNLKLYGQGTKTLEFISYISQTIRNMKTLGKTKAKIEGYLSFSVHKFSNQKSYLCLQMSQPKEAPLVEMLNFYRFCRFLHVVCYSEHPQKDVNWSISR